MQIDFHHGVTYVLARLAGFNRTQAATIAHAAQYVDDATREGYIRFNNLSLYARTSSAHRMLDYRNFQALANCRVWIPFHFLPGNGGLPAGSGNELDYVDKIVCRPNSFVAQDMVAEAIKQRERPDGLHRLGITMHVYADTWAHQGFVGINDNYNMVHDLRDHEDQPDVGFLARLKHFFGDRFDEDQSTFIGDVLPVGHGAALSYPDRPYLKWTYRNGRGEVITRDNPAQFLDAAEHLCMAMQRYRSGAAAASVPGLSACDRDKIASLFADFTDEDSDVRHQGWLEAVARGKFSFGAEKAPLYSPSGPGSWVHTALGLDEEPDEEETQLPFSPAFLNADWTLFHNALQTHRLFICCDLLPRYGIVAG